MELIIGQTMTKPGKPYFRTVILMRMELFFFILYFLNFLERIYKIGLKLAKFNNN